MVNQAETQPQKSEISVDTIIAISDYMTTILTRGWVTEMEKLLENGKSEEFWAEVTAVTKFIRICIGDYCGKRADKHKRELAEKHASCVIEDAAFALTKKSTGRAEIRKIAALVDSGTDRAATPSTDEHGDGPFPGMDKYAPVTDVLADAIRAVIVERKKTL